MKTRSRGIATIVVALVVLLAAAVAGGTVAVVMLLNRDTGEPVVNPDGLQIGYASEGVTILDEADAQQQAINDLLRGGSGLSIDYKSDAYSANGKDFECYIGNSDVNSEDMYIQICSDSAIVSATNS